MHIAYPFRIDGRGLSATASTEQHIRELIEQVLFTMPGERVNRPTFGSGIMQMVFAPNSTELGAATQFLVQSALQEWIGHLIDVQSVAVDVDNATLRVSVRYLVRRTGEEQTANVAREVTA